MPVRRAKTEIMRVRDDREIETEARERETEVTDTGEKEG